MIFGFRKNNGQVTNGARNGADLQATQLAGAADDVRETATRTLRGIETQRPLLTKAMQATRGVSASLRDSTEQAAGLATSTEQIASSVNEMAASIEQVTANSVNLAASVTETSTAVEEVSRSIGSVAARHSG